MVIHKKKHDATIVQGQKIKVDGALIKYINEYFYLGTWFHNEIYQTSLLETDVKNWKKTSQN